MSAGEWIRCDDAVRELQRHLKSAVGIADPAPWIDRSPEWHQTPENVFSHKWVARTSLTLRRAFLAGDLEAYLVEGDRCRDIPGWAWENAEASANAFHFGWLPIDPFSQSGLEGLQNWRCFVDRSEFAAWLQQDGVAETRNLPDLPTAFDLADRPPPIAYSEPSERPFVELTEALTWAAFGIAMSREVFGYAEHCRFGVFQSADWQDALRGAVTSFAEKASGGLIRVRGRYVANYSDHSAAKNADTKYLDDSQLRDFACFDSLHGGLERGNGLTWERQSLDWALEGRADGWRDVEVSRADLLRYFPVKLDSTRALLDPLPATLPGIGAVMGLEEAICLAAYGKPSNDLLIWETAGGDWVFWDSEGTVIPLTEDGEMPEAVARSFGQRKAASLALRNAACAGVLTCYVAPKDGQPLAVPRFYWNSGDPECLDLSYQGFADSDAGRGSPVLLSRQAFDAWLAAIRDRTRAGEAAARRPSTKKRGRTKGSGSFEASDAPLLEEMKQMIACGEAFSPDGAAKQVASRAKGGGTEASRATRLANRYRASENK